MQTSSGQELFRPLLIVRQDKTGCYCATLSNLNGNSYNNRKVGDKKQDVVDFITGVMNIYPDTLDLNIPAEINEMLVIKCSGPRSIGLVR